MKCPGCGREMDLEDKDTSSGYDMRTYRCATCGQSHIVDFGTATWKALSDARSESLVTRLIRLVRRALRA